MAVTPYQSDAPQTDNAFKSGVEMTDLDIMHRPWESYEQLFAALPDTNEIVKRNEKYFRRLVVHMGEQVMVGGVLHQKKEAVYRGIALRFSEAQRLTTMGIPTDYYDPELDSWIRGGFKVEREFVHAHDVTAEVIYDPATPEEKAAYELAQRQYERAAPPVVLTEMDAPPVVERPKAAKEAVHA